MGISSFKGEKITIYVDSEKCIHARNCVLNIPNVFIPNYDGEDWVRPDAEDVEIVAEVIRRCPSGALTYERHDQGTEENKPMVNQVYVWENGPYGVHADLNIEGQEPRTRATLCRCGQSANKPFCDATHRNFDFVATGEIRPAADSETLEQRDGPLNVNPLKDGPYQVKGNQEICQGTGHTIKKCKESYLCRCGGSMKKPFCDGSHTKIGFKS